MSRPTAGIVTDAAHSTKREVTEYQGVDLTTGERLFYEDLGFQTVNIGEFMGVIEAIKYIIETGYEPKIIYTDSQTALSWIKNKKTASNKRYPDLQKAEIFLKALSSDTNQIQILHWDNKGWGENPADFGNK